MKREEKNSRRHGVNACQDRQPPDIGRVSSGASSVKRILLSELNSIRVDRLIVRSRSRTCSRVVTSADPRRGRSGLYRWPERVGTRAQTGNPPSRHECSAHQAGRHRAANNRPVGANPTEAFPSGVSELPTGRSDSDVYPPGCEPPPSPSPPPPPPLLFSDNFVANCS